MHQGVEKLIALMSNTLNQAFLNAQEKIFHLAMAEFFFPELEQRQRKGKAPTSLEEVWAGQVLMHDNNLDEPEIRFNEEVKLNIISNGHQQLKEGEITQSDVKSAFGGIEGLAPAKEEQGISQLAFVKVENKLHWQFPDMFRLIRSLAPKVARICEGCGRLFEPDKRNIDNQKYCSTRCRNKHYMKNYRQRVK